MKAPAKAAGDVAEAQRRTQEGAAERPPAVVVKPGLAVRTIEGESETRRARHVDTRGKNTAQPLLPLG